MSNYELIVNANRLLAIFSKDNCIQPWRFQPQLQILVPFEEYVKFCEMCVQSNLKGVLTYDLNSYKEHLNNIDMMQRFYFVDLSMVIWHELLLASKNDKSMTKINHFFKNASKLDHIQMKQKINQIKTTDYQKALELLVNSESNTNISLSQYHYKQQAYAILLLASSLSEEQLIFNFKMEEFA
jgi:hypothetical protein